MVASTDKAKAATILESLLRPSQHSDVSGPVHGPLGFAGRGQNVFYGRGGDRAPPRNPSPGYGLSENTPRA